MPWPLEGERGVGSRDSIVQAAHGVARFHTELVGDGAAQVAVDLEGFGLVPGAVEGEHELAVEGLSPGITIDQGVEFPDDGLVSGKIEVGFDAALEGEDVVFAEFPDAWCIV